MDLDKLEAIIIKAKKYCYVGDGQKAVSSRTESHDLEFVEDDWRYLDSYFGGTDFLGQEVVWYKDKPVWAMNYYGRIIRDDLLKADQSGFIIRKSLSKLYEENRFLGQFEYDVDGFLYEDVSEGNYKNFKGEETISKDGICLYELDYHGGIIRE